MLFREGFVSRMIEKINAMPDRRNVINQVAGSKEAREKIAVALGPGGMQKIEATVLVENIMDKARGMLGNSTTAKQLIAAGMAGGTLGAFTGGDFTTWAGAAAAARGGSKLLGQRIDQNVARKVGELLASDDLASLRKGLALSSRDPRVLNALRSIDDYVTKVGGQQSGSIPALQSMGAGRAEDQPNVPRPRRQ